MPEMIIYIALAILAVCLLRVGYDMTKPKPKERKDNDD